MAPPCPQGTQQTTWMHQWISAHSRRHTPPPAHNLQGAFGKLRCKVATAAVCTEAEPRHGGQDAPQPPTRCIPQRTQSAHAIDSGEVQCTVHSQPNRQLPAELGAHHDEQEEGDGRHDGACRQHTAARGNFACRGLGGSDGTLALERQQARSICRGAKLHLHASLTLCAKHIARGAWEWQLARLACRAMPCHAMRQPQADCGMSYRAAHRCSSRTGRCWLQGQGGVGSAGWGKARGTHWATGLAESVCLGTLHSRAANAQQQPSRPTDVRQRCCACSPGKQQSHLCS